MASWIRYALLLAVVVSAVSAQRDLSQFIPGRPVPGVAPGIQPLSAGVQTRPFQRPSQGLLRPLPRPSRQQGGFAVPNPQRPQVQPRPFGK